MLTNGWTNIHVRTYKQMDARMNGKTKTIYPGHTLSAGGIIIPHPFYLLDLAPCVYVFVPELIRAGAISSMHRYIVTFLLAILNCDTDSVYRYLTILLRYINKGPKHKRHIFSEPLTPIKIVYPKGATYIQ